MNAIFDWHSATWSQIMAMRGRLPHAFLLYGAAGIGKVAFAEHLAKSILCESPHSDGHACAQCLSCNWFNQYSHPDYRRVRPGAVDESEAQENDAESDNPSDQNDQSGDKKSAKAAKSASKEIVIDQVRALAQFMNVSTHRQGRRVILMYPAEALNVPAANALLKSLEEPNPDTVFILVSHQIDRLLPTILSRCHKLALKTPSREQALSWLSSQGLAKPELWLAQQGGAPRLALEAAQAEDVNEIQDLLRALAQPDRERSLKLAEQLQKQDMPKIVAFLQRWLYDVFLFQHCAQIRYFPSYHQEIARLATRISRESLLHLLKSAQERQAIASHPLSGKLFLEDMLLEYASQFAS